MSEDKISEAAAPKEVWVEVCTGTPMDVHKMPKSNDGFPSGWEVVRYIRDDLHDETHSQPADLAEQQGVDGYDKRVDLIARLYMARDMERAGAWSYLFAEAADALAATGKQQAGEVQGDTLSLAECITDHLCQHEYDIGGRAELLVCVTEALAALQSAGQVVGYVSRDSSKAHMCVNLPEGSPIYAIAARQPGVE